MPREKASGAPLQKTPSQRQIESDYPELASGIHLPKFARGMAVSEPASSDKFAGPFLPRYAVNVQLLNADGRPDSGTSVYSAVLLPEPMAGNDSGMFPFPLEGTLVEVAFTGGRPDKSFVRQTVPEGTSLPDVKPDEQLQQQRAEVSQRVTRHWCTSQCERFYAGGCQGGADPQQIPEDNRLIPARAMRAFLYPHARRHATRCGRMKHHPAIKNTLKRSRQHRYAGAAARRQNKCVADKNGTTPHLPASFGSQKIFSFVFLQTSLPARATTDGVPGILN